LSSELHFPQGLPRGAYTNQCWIDFTGMSPAQSLGWGWTNVVHPDDIDFNLKVWNEARSKGESLASELRLRRHDGVFRWHIVRGRPLMDTSGSVVRWLGTITEIEEEKEAHEAIQKALTARNDLLSVCSHELRTPIAAMKLQTQMALRNIEKGVAGALDASTIKDWLVQSNKQLDRLTRLLEEILDFSRVLGGRLKLTIEPFDLGELVNEVAKRFGPKMEEVHSTLECSIQNPLPVTADRFRMDQVLTNIIGNAIQYAPGKPICISLTADDKAAFLSVQDCGNGIAVEDTERIFEPYERAISPMHMSGLGLGLYISRQIVLAHKGTIRAQNRSDGTGALFIVEIPR
jgi:PAS domain S-box-containing protein